MAEKFEILTRWIASGVILCATIFGPAVHIHQHACHSHSSDCHSPCCLTSSDDLQTATGDEGRRRSRCCGHDGVCVRSSENPFERHRRVTALASPAASPRTSHGASSSEEVPGHSVAGNAHDTHGANDHGSHDHAPHRHAPHDHNCRICLVLAQCADVPAVVAMLMASESVAMADCRDEAGVFLPAAPAAARGPPLI